ncbi:MAG: acetate kinase [Myxococcota bacterium]|nr:acetate kinase [Myxococcota bacterium]
MRVLALNCGSSSIKSVVVETATGARVFERARELDTEGHPGALAALLVELRDRSLLDGIEAAGHRVVHGGERFRASVRVDARVLDEIEAVAPMAPLHNPANIQGIRALQQALPSVPQVAVFDTAFHQTLPPRAYLYAVPYALYRDHGVRRYGFHGSSHRFVAREAARRLGRPLDRVRLVSAHLGNGCSATAIRDGVSVDTSMGLSPLEGLVMGTRSGDVDPGLHEFLAARLGLDLAEVTALLNRESGLLGLSELSSDMRELEEARRDGHAGADRAIESFCYRLARQVASFIVALDRLDALVFTGGIGEHSAYVRARVLGLLEPLGFEVDPERNARHGAESGGEISLGGRPVALVVPTDEERLIADETAAVVTGTAR